jgi:hypothetical protein
VLNGENANKKENNMAEFQDLISPAMIELDEDGRDLYASMREAENEVTAELMRLGAVIYQCGETVLPTGDATGGRRKLAVVSPAILATVHAKWPMLLTYMRDSRLEFQAYLDANKDRRTQGAGVRSTAPATWIGHQVDLESTAVAERLRFSHWMAYRAGKLTAGEVRMIIEKKLSDTQGYIVNAGKARQPGRVADFSTRLKKLEKELGAFKAVNGQFLARVLSGQGLRFSAKWPDKSVGEFGVPHLTLIAAKGAPEAAPSRERGSKYGEPILALEECRLMLFRALKPD